MKYTAWTGVAMVAGTVIVALAQPSWVPPGERATTWKPGVQGGVPYRQTVCAIVQAPAGDAASVIQTALDNCATGQVVKLGPGTFTINSNIVYIRRGVTLRGAGLGADGKHLTSLQKTNGSQPGTYIPIVRDPVVIMGPRRWTDPGTSYNLVADGLKESSTITVASGTFQPGQIILIDELSGADWRPDPQGRGQIWASAEFSVVWQRHNPAQGTDDPWPAANAWFSREDRPQAEVHEVAAFDAVTKKITLTSPLHKVFRVSQLAQVYAYVAADTPVTRAGLEDVRIEGGGDGNVRMEGCTECWVARTENTAWLGEGVAVNRSFRAEVRDSYIHDGVWSSPGGGGYALSLGNGSADVLVENNIIRKANKVMVARSSGAGSVVSYNYVDDGFIINTESWVEIGLNASHMVGPHHVLFEGNYGFNFDSDKTHGNSTYMTVFRNHLSGRRKSFSDGGPKRAAGAAAFGHYMTYAGNVLGYSGMPAWAYESGSMSTPAIWLFGWDDWAPYPNDPQVKATAVREVNYDYVTNSVRSDSPSLPSLPNSLYLTGRPDWWPSGMPWPWVDPLSTAKIAQLPAKVRYESGSPNVAPPEGATPTPTSTPVPSTATPTSTPTPSPTATSTPTLTPVPPTVTPTSTPTVVPTATPQPTTTPVPVCNPPLGYQIAAMWPTSLADRKNELTIKNQAGYELDLVSGSHAVYKRVRCQ